MNVFLRTRLLRNVLRSAQHDIVVDYAGAFSVVPGRIHVHHLEIRGEDSAVQWILHIEHASFTVSLGELLHQHFHASRVDGDEVDFRVRIKFYEAPPEHIVALPPLEGFGPLPIKDPGPPPPGPTDAKYNLWMVQLDAVDAQHVREIWVDTLRFTGDMRVRGGWVFRPLRSLQVGPATIDGLAEVSYGAKPLLTNVDGTIQATVHPVDLKPDEPEFVRNISTDTELRGTMRTSQLLESFVHAPGATFHGEDPHFDVRVVVDHGVLGPSTRVHTDAARYGADGLGASVDASIETSSRVDREGGQPKAIAVMAVRDASIQAGAARASAESFVATVTSAELDLNRPFRDATFDADLHALRSAALAPWGALIPTSTHVAILSGRLSAECHLEGSFADQRARGEASFNAQGLLMTRMGDRAAADVAARIVLDDASLKDTRFDFGSSRIDMEGLAVNWRDLAVHADKVSITARRMAMRGGAVDLSEGDVAFATASACLRQESSPESCVVAPHFFVRAPNINVGAKALGGRVSFVLPGAQVSRVSSLLSPLPWPRGVQIEGGQATARAALEVDLVSQTATGTGEVQINGLRAQAAADAAIAKTDIRVYATRRGAATDLSGSSVFVTGPEGAEGAWWGGVELRQARLRLRGGPRLCALVHLSAKDASPVVAVVGALTPVPEWLAKIPSTTGVEGEGEIRATPSSFQIRSARARGGQVDVRVAFAEGASPTRGALLLNYGDLRAGVGLGGNDGGVRLFGAEPWFDSVAANVNARSAEAPCDCSQCTGGLSFSPFRPRSARTREMETAGGPAREP